MLPKKVKEKDNIYLTEKRLRDEIATEYKSYFGVMVFFTILILAALGFFIYDYLEDKNNHIPIANCNKPGGEFATEPETDYSQNCLLTTCVDSAGRPNQPCTFNGIENLNQAMKICNQNIDKCNRFTYFSNNNSMAIVTLDCTQPVKNTLTTSFVRQVGITYTEPGDSTPTVSGLPTTNTSTSVNTFNPSSVSTSSGSQTLGTNISSY